MTPDKFVHRGDLVSEINRLGALYDIKEEAVDTSNVFMLSCGNKSEKCEAKIIGIYSQKSKLYYIKRLDSIHSCTKGTKRDLALQNEISKHQRTCKRLGELVECLYAKFKTGYFEVFKASIKCSQGFVAGQGYETPRFEFFDKENSKNTAEAAPISNGLIGTDSFIREAQMFDYDSCRDSVISQKTDDSKYECLRALKEEFLLLNPGMVCEFTRNNFFFKHVQMSKILRKICEIKISPRTNGTVVLGLLFDPNDDYIIQSVLVSEESKIKALEIFLDHDERDPLFYIVDLDFEVIECLKTRGTPFFVKSRAVFHYIHDQEDIYSQIYYNEINYGEREFLDLDKAFYLRRFCPTNLFNLNNACFPDFDYVSPYILSLPFVDCITSLMWSISEDIKSRKIFVGEDYSSRFPETITGLFEEFNETEPTVDHEVDLSAGTCTCGIFQEFLFPCIHAYKRIRQEGRDPLLYTSSVYNRENMVKVEDIVPVVNVKVHPFKARATTKKKRGEVDSSCEK